MHSCKVENHSKQISFWTKAKKANRVPLKSRSTFSSETIGLAVPLEKRQWTDNGDHGPALIFLCWKRVAVVRSCCSRSFGKISADLELKTISTKLPRASPIWGLLRPPTIDFKAQWVRVTLGSLVKRQQRRINNIQFWRSLHCLFFLWSG